MKKLNKIKNYSLKTAKIGKKKKVKGFTLVELIVVIAIIGVLAIVLIPNMMGYISKAKLSTANDTAAKIAEQVNLISADLETRGVTLAGKVYQADATDLSTEAADTSNTNTLGYQLSKAIPDLDLTNNQIAIGIGTDGQVEYVVYAADSTTKNVGTYPKQTTVDDVDGKKFSDFSDGTFAKGESADDAG